MKIMWSIASIPTRFTFTLTDALAVPPGPVAVAVKVVSLFGETLVDPFGPTVPIPGVKFMDVAPTLDHVNFDDSPGVMLSGLAAIWTVTLASTVRVALAEAVPPGPFAVA